MDLCLVALEVLDYHLHMEECHLLVWIKGLQDHMDMALMVHQDLMAHMDHQDLMGLHTEFHHRLIKDLEVHLL